MDAYEVKRALRPHPFANGCVRRHAVHGPGLRHAWAIAGALYLLMGYASASAQPPRGVEADSLHAINGESSVKDDWSKRGLAWISCGGGSHGATAGLGFRYRWFGVEQSVVTNGAETTPYYPDDRAVPSGTFTVVSFRDPAIGIDGSLYWDIGRFSIFGSAGYFEQTTHLFRRSDTDGRLYSGLSDPVQRWFGYGGGVHYFISPGFAVGGGYHSFRGAYLLIGIWP